MGVDVRAAVAATLLAVSLVGCTPEPVVTPTPTPASQSSTETEQEREQRVAYEAAEKSYREFRAEIDRLRNSGGASEATSVMKMYAAGQYLKDYTEIIQAYKRTGNHTTGAEKIGYLRPAGYTSTSLVLDVCEDGRAIRAFDKDGKEFGKGEILQARVEVRRIAGIWKLWSAPGTKVKSCDG